MSGKVFLATVLSLFALGSAQRAGFAGSRPYGYPVIIATSTPGAAGSLGDRFGEDTAVQVQPTTPPPGLPIEANGNTQFVNYMNTLPVDQRPFWLINSQAMDDNRNRPQTWASKANGYIDTASQGGGSKPELVHDYRSFV